MKYRKKPLVVEAFRYGMEETPEWFKEAHRMCSITMYSQYGGEVQYCEIQTLEGTMRANYGDYIVKGVQGEYYPVKPDIFHETYEKVRE